MPPYRGLPPTHRVHLLCNSPMQPLPLGNKQMLVGFGLCCCLDPRPPGCRVGRLVAEQLGELSVTDRCLVTDYAVCPQRLLEQRDPTASSRLADLPFIIDQGDMHRLEIIAGVRHPSPRFLE